MNNKYDREEAPKSYDEMVADGYEMTGDGFWVPGEEENIVITAESTSAVKLLLLQSGEEVLCTYTESMYTDKCFLGNPMSVIVQSTASDGGNERTSTVAFSDWMPLSEDRNIEVSRSFIVAVTTPIESLVESYQKNG